MRFIVDLHELPVMGITLMQFLEEVDVEHCLDVIGLCRLHTKQAKRQLGSSKRKPQLWIVEAFKEIRGKLKIPLICENVRNVMCIFCWFC